MKNIFFRKTASEIMLYLLIILVPVFVVTFAQSIFVFFLPIFVFFMLLFFWLRYGRDYHSKDVVIHHFEPPHRMTPLEAGVILHGKVRHQDVTAQILYLSSQGYFSVRKEYINGKEDYVFRRNTQKPDPLNVYDSSILRALFGIRLHFSGVKEDDEGIERLITYTTEGKLLGALQHLSDDIARNMEDIRNEVSAVLVAKKYYFLWPSRLNEIFNIFTMIVLFIMAILFFEDMARLGGAMFSLISVLVLLLVFQKIMPALTREGVKAKKELEGYRRYLEVAEKERIQFFYAPERKKEEIEAVLAYAMVFGLENKWKKEFEGLYPIVG